MAIRYDGKLNSEINKVVTSFNRKIKRLTAKDVTRLPELTSVRQLKSEFTSRKELLREIRNMAEFTKRGGETLIKTTEGAYIPRWQYNTLKRDARVAKSRLTRQIHKAEALEGSHRYPMMASERLSNLRSKRTILDRPIMNLTRSKLETFKRTVENEMTDAKRMAQFQKNFVERLFDSVAYMNDQDEEFVKGMQEYFLSMSPEEFYNMYMENPELQDIKNKYDILTLPANANGTLPTIKFDDRGNISNLEDGVSIDATQSFDWIRQNFFKNNT